MDRDRCAACLGSRPCCCALARDQLEDALLVGVKVAAMHTGFLTDMNGTWMLPYDGSQAGNILESGSERKISRCCPMAMT